MILQKYFLPLYLSSLKSTVCLFCCLSSGFKLQFAEEYFQMKEDAPGYAFDCESAGVCGRNFINLDGNVRFGSSDHRQKGSLK